MEKQLNTSRKRKHANYTNNNNIVKNLLDKNTNSQSDSNSSDKYEKRYDAKISITVKKTKKKIKMELNTAGQKEYALSFILCCRY